MAHQAQSKLPTRGEDEEWWHAYTINPLPRCHLTKISVLLGGVILAREPLAGEGVLVVADPWAALIISDLLVFFLVFVYAYNDFF